MIDAQDAAWLGALLVATIALWSIRYVQQRHPRETFRAPIRKRDEEHEARLAAIQDWLAQPRIVRAILRSKWATSEGLKALVITSGQLTREELDIAIGNILADRHVRQVICEYMVKAYRLPQFRVMQALLDYAGKRRESA